MAVRIADPAAGAILDRALASCALEHVADESTQQQGPDPEVDEVTVDGGQVRHESSRHAFECQLSGSRCLVG